MEAQLLFQQNKPADALEVLNKGLKIDQRDEWLLENIAFAKLSLKDVSGAMAVVEQWIKFQPNATKALLVMAYLKFNEKNYLAAIPYLQKILQVLAATPNEPHYAEALHLMGQIYYQQNQTQEATNFLKQACELGFQESCNHPLVKDLALNPKSNPGPASVGPATVTAPANANAPTSNPPNDAVAPDPGAPGAGDLHAPDAGTATP